MDQFEEYEWFPPVEFKPDQQPPPPPTLPPPIIDDIADNMLEAAQLLDTDEDTEVRARLDGLYHVFTTIVRKRDQRIAELDQQVSEKRAKSDRWQDKYLKVLKAIEDINKDSGDTPAK